MTKKGARTAPRVKVKCPCGVEFEVLKNRYDSGRGRRCSKACQYRYATRPSGLTYVLTKENPTSFKAGAVPWNKGTVGVMVAWNKGLRRDFIPPNAFKPGENLGPANVKWRGDKVHYFALHGWVGRHKTKTGSCSQCGETRYAEWSNISHEYRRDLDDYRELCKPCHTVRPEF
jgi:hypothetical protein